jgi:hypothetical protein
MFEKITKKDKRTILEKEMEDVVKIMSTHQPDSKEYSVMAENLERLNKVYAQQCERKTKPDTKWLIAGNLLIVGLVLGFERAGIITTKALGYIIKGRV